MEVSINQGDIVLFYRQPMETEGLWRL